MYAYSLYNYIWMTIIDYRSTCSIIFDKFTEHAAYNVCSKHCDVIWQNTATNTQATCISGMKHPVT